MTVVVWIRFMFSLMSAACVSSFKCCMLCLVCSLLLSAVFCTVCSFCMLAVDVMGYHMVEAYSSMGLVMAFYVETIVSLCLPHLVDGTLSNILDALDAVFVVYEFGIEGETQYFWGCSCLVCCC